MSRRFSSGINPEALKRAGKEVPKAALAGKYGNRVFAVLDVLEWNDNAPVVLVTPRGVSPDIGGLNYG